MTFSLATKLMIVNLSVSTWEGRKLDKRITTKTISDNAVQDDDGLRVNKLLVPKDAFKDVQRCTSNLRTLVRECTLPWKDNGDRAIMRQGYQDFMLKFETAAGEWRGAVSEFVHVRYPAARAKASFNLGDAYDPADYPGAEELMTKFKLSLDIDAIAEPEDFRVKLNDATVADIQGKMRDAIEQRVHNAMRDVWSRVATMVEHFVERTTPDVQRFHDTTVTNMIDLVDLLPSLNLIGDPDLKAIAKRLRDTLCGYDPKDLRKNVDIREAAHDEAAQIMEEMKGFMAAFA